MTPEQIPVVEQILGATTPPPPAIAPLDAHGVHGVNVMASPGAGKTTRSLGPAVARCGERRRVAVIEGDVASEHRCRQGARPGPARRTDQHRRRMSPRRPAGGCSPRPTPLSEVDPLFIENVGNLICPVGFDLGEHTLSMSFLISLILPHSVMLLVSSPFSDLYKFLNQHFYEEGQRLVLNH